MSAVGLAEEPAIINLRCELPEKLGFLMEMHPYKVAYGGRNGAKSTSFAIALLSLGAAQPLRILCAREVQKSIKDSVHAQLKDLIDQMGLGDFYEVLDNEIRGANGTTFIFAGLLAHNVNTIKSFANIDVCWVEEGQAVSKRSWDILIPTIRAENSEIWVSFNPDMDSDDTWKRWVEHPLPGTVCVKINWSDNPWHSAGQEAKRLHCKLYQPKDYDNIWEGVPKSVVEGAIYATEIVAMIEEKRIRPMPYDPRFPVHRIWDLGWNDAMAIIMFQKTSPTSLNLINYLEDSFKRYDELISDMKTLRYNFGEDWLPFDGDQHNPQTGSSAKKLLKGLGCKVRDIPKTGDEPRIKAARMLFPRIYIDDTERERDTGYLGGKRLIEVLKRYRRIVPKTTDEPASPRHDQYSHGASAFGALAEIAHLVKNDFEERPIELLPMAPNFDPGMGALG